MTAVNFCLPRLASAHFWFVKGKSVRYISGVFSLTMLGSGSAGNSALLRTDHCRVLVDGGLSARQIVLRLALCGVTPDQLDGVLLTHEHGDHVCGLEVLCRKYHIPIYCNALTAEAIRCGTLAEHRNWRIFRTGVTFSICDLTVESFPVPHDAVEPIGFAFHAGSSAVGFLTDLGYATRLIVERMREVQTLVIETNHDEKLLQACPHRPWPVKQRIQSRHGHLSNAAAATVIEQLLPGKIERVVLGHLSRDCNTPELAAGAIRAQLEKSGRTEVEIFCAGQSEISRRFAIGQTFAPSFQPTFDNVFFETISAPGGATRAA
jgi:phosphoribosyl 1,2-cyclic phosphodiesterase